MFLTTTYGFLAAFAATILIVVAQSYLRFEVAAKNAYARWLHAVQLRPPPLAAHVALVLLWRASQVLAPLATIATLASLVLNVVRIARSM